jgi:hypothetical protein
VSRFSLEEQIASRQAIPTRKELIMMRVDHREKDLENHDRGLDYDLARLLHRRGMLKLVAGAGLAGAGLITLGACADATSTADTTPPRAGGHQAEGQAVPPSQPRSATRPTARSRKRRRAHIQAMVRTGRMC